MFDGREPIYHQIAEAIRGEVLSGALEEEDQVMSTTQYATTYRINPATAAKAFAQLVDEGVLYKRRGVGMFVAPGAADRLRAERRKDGNGKRKCHTHEKLHICTNEWGAATLEQRAATAAPPREREIHPSLAVLREPYSAYGIAP